LQSAIQDELRPEEPNQYGDEDESWDEKENTHGAINIQIGANGDFFAPKLQQ
jgi:hypothetical protein